MNRTALRYLSVFITVLIALGAAFAWLDEEVELQKPGSEPGHEESKKQRAEYQFQLLRDPATNSIPGNIRSRELKHAKSLPAAGQSISGSGSAKTRTSSLSNHFVWSSAGPSDIGGRTRALNIDPRDPDVIIAGAVSGGIWKSTDGGSTWTLKTPDISNLSVTSLARDPRKPDTLYYSSGEFIGNSAGDKGAFYFGTGIFKSTDNGETWSKLTDTDDSDTGYNTQYDVISRIVVSPVTGTVLFSSNGFGIYRSTDGQTFTADPVLGTEGAQRYCDVAVASDGTFLAVISEANFPNSPPHNPGVFISTDDGQSWNEITPGSFPDTHQRSVAAFAPSNPDVAYILTHVSTDANNSTQEDIRLHKLDLASNLAEDRSSNIPDFGGSVGSFWSQNGYDLEIAVKPDNEDFILIGGTNLFRGRNGFASAPDNSDEDEYWIGGYDKDNDVSQYPGQHPDQHIMAFDPNNPDRMWAGHDGGLSVTSDVTAASVSWTDMNNAYITTQFYASAIPRAADDNRLVGGTQDNGSPFFRYSGQQSQQTSNDITFGDGGYAFFSTNYLFVSRQRGDVIRYNTTTTGDIISSSFVFVQPVGAVNQLFIHPYAIDPNDETIMYYPDGTKLWRNTQLELISNRDSEGTTTGWEELNFAELPSGYNISALTVSKAPADILYYAGSDADLTDNTNRKPIIVRINSARSAGTTEDTTHVPIGNADAGSYVKHLATNPVNGNEVLAVMSNYNITGIYHSTNGGETWNAVEGNLTGTSTNPGPSIRSATIIPAESGTIYQVSTSTGVYSTQNLDGTNTSWAQQSVDKIGYAVTDYLDSRASDGDIAAGTHGRGMFVAEFQGSTDVPFITANPPQAKPGDEITISATNFQFNSQASANTVRFGRVEATVTGASASSINAIVPRNAVPRDAPSSAVALSVTSDKQTVSTTFRVLPPATFTLEQNYPNPFNPNTVVPLDIPQDSRVTFTVYDMAGRRVKEVIRDATYQAGSYNVQLDFTGLSSGVYIYQAIIDPTGQGGSRRVESKKLTFIK